jgi:hypothetical protein
MAMIVGNYIVGNVMCGVDVCVNVTSQKDEFDLYKYIVSAVSPRIM